MGLHISLYGYVPNLAANIVGAALFFVILVVQVVLGLYTRDWWMFVTWGITAGLEIACYVARSIAHHYPASFPMYKMQLVCSVIAPAFMAAGLYYQLGKQVTIYGEKYSLLPPMIYTAIFTTADVISLVVQGVGGGIAAADLNTPEGPANGGWIMVGGISFQVLILGIFILMWAVVNWKIYRDSSANWDPAFAANRRRPMFKWLFPAVNASLLFLMLRSIYRIIEIAAGWKGGIMRTERYFLILDGLMIVIGMAPLCIVYPGLAYGHVPVRGLHYKANKKPQYEDRTSSEDFGESSEFDEKFTPGVASPAQNF